MNKVNNEPMARKLAVENGECYGKSVFGGDWYTGTREQLERIGVTDVVDPQCVKGDAALGLALRILLESVAAQQNLSKRLYLCVDIAPMNIKIRARTSADAEWVYVGAEPLPNIDAALLIQAARFVNDFVAQNPAPSA